MVTNLGLRVDASRLTGESESIGAHAFVFAFACLVGKGRGGRAHRPSQVQPASPSVMSDSFVASTTAAVVEPDLQRCRPLSLRVPTAYPTRHSVGSPASFSRKILSVMNIEGPDIRFDV